MKVEVLAEGFITKRELGSETALAGGSRAVITTNGDLVCTYAVQSALGINNLMPAVSRSTDSGITWEEQGQIWPHFRNSRSITGSVSRSLSGKLFLYGISIPIDQPGETFWSNETQGIKQNELFWAISDNSGRTWTEPHHIPLPILGSAEAPGALCVTQKGRWLACYSPYNTFDSRVKVDRQQVILILSDDAGRTWDHTAMLRFDEEHSGGAEAWVIELSDGRILGTCWHLDHQGDLEYPNVFSLSHNGGRTWISTQSTGIMGQSTALAALSDGRALFIYNQRKHGDLGIWLAVVRPTDSDFGIESNQIVWRAQTATQNESSADHYDWRDFSFGEPSVTPLPDGTLLVTFWCVQPDGQGIRFVKCMMKE